LFFAGRLALANRFVSGGRIYQRKGVQLSFAAKESFHDSAPLKTVKLPMRQDQGFTECVESVVRSIKDARGDSISMVDKELKPTLFVPMTGKALKEGPEPRPGAGATAPSDGTRPRRRRNRDAGQSRSSAG